MWKRVLTIGVLLAIGLPVYGEQKGGKPKGDQGKSEPTQAPPSSALGKVTCLIKQDGTAIECHYPQANPPSYLSRLISPENLPNLLLFFVGLGGIYVAVCTLKKLGSQTDTMKNQVGLMKEQIDRTIERERARLSLEVKPISFDDQEGSEVLNLFSCLEIINVGHSNAYIRFGAAKFAVVERGEELPGVDPEELTFGNDVLVPSGSPTFAGFWREVVTGNDFDKRLAEASIQIHAYGFFEYESMGISWHRDFGYRWVIWEEIPDDPSRVLYRDFKNRLCLSGQWEQNPRQKNGEYKMPANPN